MGKKREELKRNTVAAKLSDYELDRLELLRSREENPGKLGTFLRRLINTSVEKQLNEN